VALALIKKIRPNLPVILVSGYDARGTKGLLNNNLYRSTERIRLDNRAR
jgi:hypothetical protein